MPAPVLRQFIASLIVLTTVIYCFGFGASDAAAQRARQARGPGVASRVVWSEDGKSVEFTNQGKRFKFDFETKDKTEAEAKKDGDGERPRPSFRRRRQR